jgi:hypothetical protein
MGQKGSEEVDTYELHLVLDTEELMVHVEPSVGAIGQLCHQLVAGHETGSVISQLVDESTLNIGSRLREDLSRLEHDVNARCLLDTTDDGGHSVVAAMLDVAAKFW